MLIKINMQKKLARFGKQKKPHSGGWWRISLRKRSGSEDQRMQIYKEGKNEWRTEKITQLSSIFLFIWSQSQKTFSEPPYVNRWVQLTDVSCAKIGLQGKVKKSNFKHSWNTTNISQPYPVVYVKGLSPALALSNENQDGNTILGTPP